MFPLRAKSFCYCSEMVHQQTVRHCLNLVTRSDDWLYIKVVSLLVMKVSLTSVDNLLATSKGEVLATLWKRSADVVTTLKGVSDGE